MKVAGTGLVSEGSLPSTYTGKLDTKTQSLRVTVLDTVLYILLYYTNDDR